MGWRVWDLSGQLSLRKFKGRAENKRLVPRLGRPRVLQTTTWCVRWERPVWG